MLAEQGAKQRRWRIKEGGVEQKIRAWGLPVSLSPQTESAEDVEVPRVKAEDPERAF